jgi:hypothetical protein
MAIFNPLTEVAQFDNQILIPANGSNWDATAAASTVQGLANRTRYLLNLIGNMPYYVYRNNVNVSGSPSWVYIGSNVGYFAFPLSTIPLVNDYAEVTFNVGIFQSGAPIGVGVTLGPIAAPPGSANYIANAITGSVMSGVSAALAQYGFTISGEMKITPTPIRPDTLFVITQATSAIQPVYVMDIFYKFYHQ